MPPLGAPLVTQSPDNDLAPVVGANLRRLRVKRGLSLERLAGVSGVSRAMLGQIELGKSTPTITVLWKIARALDVSFSTLLGQGERASTSVVLPRSRAKILSSQDGCFSSRALFPLDSQRQVEFYELRLAPHGIERADAHAPGTTENLVVNTGSLELSVASGGLFRTHATPRPEGLRDAGRGATHHRELELERATEHALVVLRHESRHGAVEGLRAGALPRSAESASGR